MKFVTNLAVVGAFLAYGVLHIQGPHTYFKAGWRYLFLIEGSITATIGILVSRNLLLPLSNFPKAFRHISHSTNFPQTWLYLPASPTQTSRKSHSLFKGQLRPKKGWFTEHEEYVLVTRILLDDPGKATMHNRQGLSFRALWNSLTDFDMWPIYLIGLTWRKHHFPFFPISPSSFPNIFTISKTNMHANRNPNDPRNILHNPNLQSPRF